MNGLASHLMAALVCTSFVLKSIAVTAPQAVAIVPAPVSLEQREGLFRVTASTRVIAADDAWAEASKLINLLAPALGYRLERGELPMDSGTHIQMQLKPKLVDRLGKEGYELDVTSRSILIRAGRSAGLSYGVQTLRQLLPATVFSRRQTATEWAVPCLRIRDYPRFTWRGLLIDPARHFIPVADVERFIDAMALHKFNRLQIHPTDDQGWRLEIKKYPQLTRIGSRMDFTTMRGEGGRKPGGFYTQDDIRHLVRYAAARHVAIVPEIEMPAHTGAAMVSYPHLSLYPEKLGALPPEERWTANERVLAPRPQTVAFMQDVLTEVIDLFPGTYIHIGGDEANINHWKQSEEMQTLIRQLDLKNEAELHAWFIRQMDSFLTRHRRRLIGWDEILQGGLAPGATVMSWRGQAGGITAAQAGHDVVMAPTSHTYFDYYQAPKETEPRAIGGYLPLKTVYNFEPIPAQLTSEQAQHVLGGQGQLWGEYIADRKHREYMAYPRAAALAEAIWSPREIHNYERFLIRLTAHLERLKQAEVNYRPLDEIPVK